MGRVSTPRVILGLLLWAALGAVVVPAFLSESGAAREPAARCLRFAAESPVRLTVAFPPGTRLERSDPVFVRDEAAFLISVGRVEEVLEGAVRLAVHPEHADLLREDTRLEAFTVPKTAAWVAKTLLPPERLAAIREMTARFLEREGDRIQAAVWPHLKRGLVETVALYERQLPKALAIHSERWEALFERHRDGAVRERLLPALREVTFVLAEERFSPLLEKVGKELWEALPLWGLGWRAVWEKVPLTKEGQVRERFEKYLREEARPILAKHSGEAARIAGDVIRESLKDPRVRDALGQIFREFFTDPELGALLKGLFGDLVLENEQFHELWSRRWEEGLGAAVSDSASRLEPLISRVVDSVVLSEDRSTLNPRLVRVLRARVLRKDCRWILLTAGTGSRLPDGGHLGGERE